MMHLLHSVDSLAVTNGGLPLAVCELTSALARHAGDESTLHVELISSATQCPCLHPQQVNEIKAENWRQQLSATHTQSPVALIHQHGLWVKSSNTTSTFARRHHIPIVVSPHGMLEPWALKHHRFRKQIALSLYQKRNLEQAVAFHATCEAEAQHIRDLGYAQPIAIIANGITLPNPSSDFNKSKKQRQALFLSRLHPKKGLPMLLEAWAKVRPSGWTLLIAGNDEGQHLNQLKKQCQQLNLESCVTFLGPLYDEPKQQAFQQAELFILPSHSENFGIVIAEALAHGLPVITTRETPWQSLVEKKCGWWVENTVSEISQALTTASSLSETELQTMGLRGKNLITEKFLWSKIAKQMLSFYHYLNGDKAKPDYVI